jgi:hypothetical protein
LCSRSTLRVALPLRPDFASFRVIAIGEPLIDNAVTVIIFAITEFTHDRLSGRASRLHCGVHTLWRRLVCIDHLGINVEAWIVQGCTGQREQQRNQSNGDS